MRCIREMPLRAWAKAAPSRHQGHLTKRLPYLVVTFAPGSATAGRIPDGAVVDLTISRILNDYNIYLRYIRFNRNSDFSMPCALPTEGLRAATPR
jgi:hypothetical protein